MPVLQITIADIRCDNPECERELDFPRPFVDQEILGSSSVSFDCPYCGHTNIWSKKRIIDCFLWQDDKEHGEPTHLGTAAFEEPVEMVESPGCIQAYIDSLQ